MATAEDELIPTRRSLLERLKDWDDQTGWRDFFHTYWKLIYGVARKAGLPDADAQDVVQETILAVAKTMHRYKYDPARCPFKGWLLHLTRCRIVEHLRKRERRAKALGASPDAAPVNPANIAEVADPAVPQIEAIWEEEWEKNLVDAALQRVKRQVSAQQYQMFDFYVLKGWPAREVARSLEVNIGQVYLAKHRVSALVRQETRKLADALVLPNTG